MIFSGVQIKGLIESGEISIRPFDQRNLKEASYTFTLGKKIKTLKPAPFIDSRYDAEFDELDIPEEGYLLEPNAFVVGFTNEHIELNGKYVCILSNRSSLAQMGLNITLNSILAEPSTDGKFALEIHNVGINPIKLFFGMAIVKGIFCRVENER